MNILQISWGYGVLRHFEQCFRYIVEVSFVDGLVQSELMAAILDLKLLQVGTLFQYS
jgi:hypothetical protein